MQAVLACLGLSLLLATSSRAAEALPAAEASQSTPATESTADTYKIGVDDIVQVSVWRNPELGITVPVRPDGMC